MNSCHAKNRKRTAAKQMDIIHFMLPENCCQCQTVCHLDVMFALPSSHDVVQEQPLIIRGGQKGHHLKWELEMGVLEVFLQA